jgi:hypothetical protein
MDLYATTDQEIATLPIFTLYVPDPAEPQDVARRDDGTIRLTLNRYLVLDPLGASVVSCTTESVTLEVRTNDGLSNDVQTIVIPRAAIAPLRLLVMTVDDQGEPVPAWRDAVMARAAEASR